VAPLTGFGGLREQMDRALDGVDGWFSTDEAIALFDCALRAPAVDGEVICVEIGSFKGRSTIATASALELRGQPGRVIAIDPHDGDIHGEDGETRFRAFCKNIADRGLDHRVQQVRRFSHDVALGEGPDKVSMVFLDGSHLYDDVVEDLRDWVPRVVAGGIVLLNDPFHRQVAWAIRDTIHKERMPLARPRLTTNTLVFDVAAPAGFVRRTWDRLRLRTMLPIGWRMSAFLVSLRKHPQLAKVIGRPALVTSRWFLNRLVAPFGS
jgi:predicted O-methyltransferase YrrM